MTITPKLKQMLANEVTTLATCWLLKLRSGKEMGFTDLDQDLIINGVLYHSASGFTPSAIANNSSIASDNLEIEGMLNNDLISKEDILAGKYDHAEIEIFLVNYKDLNMGRLHLKRGWFGEVVMREKMFVVEIKGLNDALNQNIGELYSHKCRAKFGDQKCGINLSKHTFNGQITEVLSHNVVIDTNRDEGDGFFKYGTIKFLSGNNQGISQEVHNFVEKGKIILAQPLPYLPQISDKYQLITGCDKKFETCYKKFNNALNFRGEPHIPGINKLLKIN